MRRTWLSCTVYLFVTLVTVSGLSAPASFAAKPQAGVIRDLQRIAEAAMGRGLTPSIAIAVVQDDRMLWESALGVGDLETGRAVNRNTRYYLSSTSKALTGLAVAQLAARGALDLDAPLSRALPGARLPAGLSSDSIRVADLLTHTHGIDGMGPVSIRRSFTGEFTNADLLASLAAHRLARNGRAFQYSNLGYDLVAILLDSARADGWKTVVEREATAPLGMTHTTAWRSRLPDSSIAMPHEMGTEQFGRVPLAKEDSNMGPAGGHFSTAGDLARLLIAEMNRGRLDGRQAIPAEVIANTWRMRVPQDKTFGPFHRYGWGLCWDLGTYGTDTLVHRFGGFSGYRSHVSFMPRRGIGVVVLTNGGDVSSPLTDAVATAIYDRLLGHADEGAYERRLSELEKNAAEIRTSNIADRAKRAARPQTLPLTRDAYAGTYVDPAYGTLVVENHDGQLIGRMGAARSPIEVFDAGKQQFRAEFFGTGMVVSAIVDSTAGRVDGFTFFNARLMRR